MLDAINAADGQRYWREADGRAWVDAWRQSGQTQVEFARSHGIHVERLARWARRLRESAPVPAGVEFLAVRLGSVQRAQVVSDARIELTLGDGRSIRLPHGFDAADLRRVLDVLGADA